MSIRKTPSRIKEINIFVDGYGLLGTVESLTPPTVKTKKEFQNGQHVDTGILEAIEFEAEVNISNMTIHKEASKLQNASLKAKGSYLEDGSNKAAALTMTGPVDISSDTWKAGDVMKTKIKQYVNVYHAEYNGEVVYDIDIPNQIAKIGGVDIYEQIRSAVM